MRRAIRSRWKVSENSSQTWSIKYKVNNIVFITSKLLVDHYETGSYWKRILAKRPDFPEKCNDCFSRFLGFIFFKDIFALSAKVFILFNVHSIKTFLFHSQCTQARKTEKQVCENRLSTTPTAPRLEFWPRWAIVGSDVHMLVSGFDRQSFWEELGIGW